MLWRRIVSKEVSSPHPRFRCVGCSGCQLQKGARCPLVGGWVRRENIGTASCMPGSRYLGVIYIFFFGFAKLARRPCGKPGRLRSLPLADSGFKPTTTDSVTSQTRWDQGWICYEISINNGIETLSCSKYLASVTWKEVTRCPPVCAQISAPKLRHGFRWKFVLEVYVYWLAGEFNLPFYRPSTLFYKRYISIL
jgi:hypothetical protein